MQARPMDKILPLAVLLLVISFHLSACGGSGSPGDDKTRYLFRLGQLFEAVGWDGGKEEVRRVALRGLLWEELNQKQSPGAQKTILRYDELTVDQDGTFTTRVLLDSLSRGIECLALSGEVDLTSLILRVGELKTLDVSECRQRAVEKMEEEGGRRRLAPQFNNGSKGIPELLELADYTAKHQCVSMETDKCERGTVRMDSWVNGTLGFQRWLACNTPISEIQLLGTHNSFNDKSDGYGTGDFALGKILEFLSGGEWEFVWAQQWFTMTDQLNMGIRHMMLDPVYFWDAMRLCHCGTTFKWFDDVLDFLEKVFHIKLQFDSDDLGCLPDDRTFEAGIQEIYDWAMLPGNEKEFIMLLVNDEGHSADWGHLDLIQDPIRNIMGDLLFTPVDKTKYFNTSWPTPNQLFQLGKRIMVTSSERCANDDIFQDMSVPSWDKDTMKYFTPFPTCGGYGPGDWYIVGGESQVVGPIYNGPEDEGLLIRENIPYLMQCPVSISSMDLASPGLVGATVWSWAEGYSVHNVSGTNCTAVDGSKQARWVTLPCSTAFYHACQSSSNATILSMSSRRGAWSQAECPSGQTFFLPATGYQNWILYQVMVSANVSTVWINLSP